MKAAALLIGFLLVGACRASLGNVTVNPVCLEPRGQLVVASRTDNVAFEETLTRRLLAKWIEASALVRVEANLTFDYYFDFRTDRSKISYDPVSGSACFSGGPLRVKKPVINSARILILEKSLWINEEREARRILESLTSRLASVGSNWMGDPAVTNACELGLREFIAGLGRDNAWAVKGLRLAWHR